MCVVMSDTVKIFIFCSIVALTFPLYPSQDVKYEGWDGIVGLVSKDAINCRATLNIARKDGECINLEPENSSGENDKEVYSCMSSATKRKLAVNNEDEDGHNPKNRGVITEVECNYFVGFAPTIRDIDDTKEYLKNHDFLPGLMCEYYSFIPDPIMENAIESGTQVLVPNAFISDAEIDEPLFDFLREFLSEQIYDYKLYSNLYALDKRVMYDDSEVDNRLQPLIACYKSEHENKPLEDSVLVVCRILLKDSSGYYMSPSEQPFEFDICEISTKEYNDLCNIRKHNLELLNKQCKLRECQRKEMESKKFSAAPVVLCNPGEGYRIVEESALVSCDGDKGGYVYTLPISNV